VEKVLRSAIANAQQQALETAKRIDEDDLVVVAAYANQGPSFKRIRPAPMGRAYRVIHRTTHLTIRVAEKPEDAAGKAK
jgi:large subunit ribosomal protein L22